MAQRMMDVIVAVSALLVLSPLLVLIAVLIRLEDGGPALFVQTRVGAGRQPFRIYKFRTMRDGRVTGFGQRLRATGLDELPQLVNMLRGDMSLIGPRPLTDADVARLKWDDDAHALRWRVRPGIIGLAQLYAGRGARLSWFLDAAYVRERRLDLDLGIVAMSAAISVIGKRRVRAWLRGRRRRLAGDQRAARRPASPTQPAFGNRLTSMTTRA